MKKTVLFVLILFSAFINEIYGQFTAAWPLVSASGKNPSVSGAQSANVLAQQMIPGSVFSGGAHNSDGFRCETTAAWPLAQTDGMHLDFPLSPNVENDMTINAAALTVKVSGSSGSSMISFAYQVDGSGSWLPFGNPVEAPSGGTSSLSLGSLNIAFNSTHTYVIRMYVYAKVSGVSSSRRVYLKDVAFSGTTVSSNAPLITLSQTTSHDFGRVVAGQSSAPAQYSVSAVRLTDTLIITAQQGFKISLDSTSSFSSVIKLPHTGGVVLSTKIYYRFVPILPAGKITGAITNASNGALTKTINVTGTALAAEPAMSSSVSFGTVTGNSIVVNANGGDGTSRVIIARAGEPVNWSPEDGVSITGENSDFSTAHDLGNGNKVVFNLPDSVSATVTVTGLDVATRYYFTVYDYNGSAGSENYLTINPGSGSVVTLTVPGIFANPQSLKFGNVLIGTVSAEKNYQLSAKYLTPADGIVNVESPAYFEISTSSGSGFSHSLSLPYSSGTLAQTNIYVRFLPDTIYDYSGAIKHFGGGAQEVNLNVTGFGRDSSSFITKAIYVSPEGSDLTGTGAIDKPFKSVYKAALKLTEGYTLVLRGGIYLRDSLHITDKTLSNISIINYPGEHPVIDGSGSQDCIILYCNNSLLRGIEVTKAGHNSLWLMGHNNRIEQCSFHDGGDSGFKLGAHYETYYPAGNLIINCDSYRNYDTRGNGGNADGFSAKWNIGSNNRFVGCRAWENSDDGWDLWQADSTVIMDSCWAFRNGHDVFNLGAEGNGNGFKIGGSPVCVPHIMRNCIAFDNSGSSGGKGFDQNSNLAGHVIYNCISFGNSYLDYNFYKQSTNGTLTAKNNIQYKGSASPFIKFVDGDVKNNSWKAFSWQTGYTWAGFTVTDNDFQSVDTTLALRPRMADGSLANTLLLKLKETSQLVNKGVDVGMPFFGSAPDLGPFESGLSTSVKQYGASMPAIYALKQNYPNPFNPATTITFSMVSDGFVQLKIFDMMGREIEAPVCGFLKKGEYKVIFEALSRPSGVYFYQLSASGYSETRKMLLLK